MQTNKQSIAGRILVIAMITCSLPILANNSANGENNTGWLVGSRQANAISDENPFGNEVQENPLDEMDALMTNEVDPDNGGDGPPPPALPLGNGLALALYGVAGYVAYKLRRKR